MQFIVLTRRRTEAFHQGEYTPKRLEAEAEAVRRLYMDGLVIRSGAVTSAAHVFSRKPPRART